MFNEPTEDMLEIAEEAINGIIDENPNQVQDAINKYVEKRFEEHFNTLKTF